MAKALPRATASTTSLPNVLGRELATILEARIIHLELAPGTHLTEQQLCSEFGVSRSPLREALRQLEGDGLVFRLTRRGVRVAPMTEKDLNDIYFCRIPLEGLAAACAARHATAEDLAFLEDAIGHMETELRASDPRAFFDGNVQFLDRIHHLSGNPILLRILSVIEKHALRYRYLAHIERAEMLTLSLEGFRRIHEAIASREPDAAERRTIRVMRDAQRIISAALRERLDGERA